MILRIAGLDQHTAEVVFMSPFEGKRVHRAAGGLGYASAKRCLA